MPASEPEARGGTPPEAPATDAAPARLGAEPTPFAGWGALLGGGAGGALVGLAAAGDVPQAVLPFSAGPLASSLPVPLVVASGTVFGATMAAAIHVVRTLGPPRARSPAAWGLWLLSVYALGGIGGCVMAQPYAWMWKETSLADYALLWGARLGGPLTLGIALAHLPQDLSPRGISRILTLFLSIAGAVVGLAAFWCSFDRGFLPTALCHGYAFGACYALGASLSLRGSGAAAH